MAPIKQKRVKEKRSAGPYIVDPASGVEILKGCAKTESAAPPYSIPDNAYVMYMSQRTPSRWISQMGARSSFGSRGIPGF